jgi:hypothetical protein
VDREPLTQQAHNWFSQSQSQASSRSTGNAGAHAHPGSVPNCSPGPSGGSGCTGNCSYGCATYCGDSGVPCTVDCFFGPPPPPPPPQDIYAEGAKVPSAPVSLLRATYITHTVSLSTSMSWLYHHGLAIAEQIKAPKENVKGTKASSDANASASGTPNGGDSNLPDKPTNDVGKPDIPQADGLPVQKTMALVQVSTAALGL